METFIGYHASNTYNLEKITFKGKTIDYVEYLGDIIKAMPKPLVKKIQEKVDEHNKYSEYYDETPINLSKLPNKIPEKIFDIKDLFEQYKDLAEIVDEIIGGIIFVDTDSCDYNYGNECYKVYMKGNNFFSLEDKLNYSPHQKQTARLFVYYYDSSPILEKITKQKNIPSNNLQLTENFKYKLKKLAGL